MIVLCKLALALLALVKWANIDDRTGLLLFSLVYFKSFVDLTDLFWWRHIG